MNDELGAGWQTRDDRLSWARLIEDHDRIGDEFRCLARLIANPEPQPQRATVLLLRLAIRVTDHLAVEDHMVESIEAASRRSGAEIAAMRTVLDEAKEDWMTYLSFWSPGMVAAHWDRFGEETRELMMRQSAQLALENAVVYSDALRHGDIDKGSFATQ